MSRLVSTVAVLVVLLGSPGLLRPQCLVDRDLDLWKLPEYLRQMTASQQRYAELEEQSVAFQKRIKLKDRVIGELAAGRTTLLEAAAQFQHADEDLPLSVSACLVGDTSQEKYCRVVIYTLQIHIERFPENVVPGVVERLERQLADHLATQ
jgi:hypothetical protein